MFHKGHQRDLLFLNKSPFHPVVLTTLLIRCKWAILQFWHYAGSWAVCAAGWSLVCLSLAPKSFLLGVGHGASFPGPANLCTLISFLQLLYYLSSEKLSLEGTGDGLIEALLLFLRSSSQTLFSIWGPVCCSKGQIFWNSKADKSFFLCFLFSYHFPKSMNPEKSNWSIRGKSWTRRWEKHFFNKVMVQKYFSITLLLCLAHCWGRIDTCKFTS